MLLRLSIERNDPEGTVRFRLCTPALCAVAALFCPAPASADSLPPVAATAAGPGIEAIPFRARHPSATPPPTLFELLPPERTGIDHLVPIERDHQMRRAFYSSMACGGVAVGDVNLNGRPDVLATSGPGKNGLFLQVGDLEFVNVAEELGLNREDRWSVHAVLVDIDNDGDLDIYILNYDQPNQLFINLLIDGGVRGETLRFEERAADYGLDIVDGSVVAAFADYDRDGHLDLYLVTHQIYREGGRPAEPIKLVEEDGIIKVEEKWRRWYYVEQGKLGAQGEYLYTEAPRRDYLFRNNGDGTFTELTEQAGITLEPHWGNSAVWWDFNNDGWPDLYVGNDFKSPDLLYRNNGDGTFTEVSQGMFPHTTWNSMGGCQADFNNRGLCDFVIADMLPRNHFMQKASFGSMAQRRRELANVEGVNQIMRNAFYVHNGTDRFLEVAWMADVAHTDWTWATRAADFDNDGWTDLFFTNGVPGPFNHSDLPPLNHPDLVGRNHFDHFLHYPVRREPNHAFRNRGDYVFEESAKAWGIDHLGMSYGACLADLDGDGRLDLLVSNLEDPLSVYHNVGAEGHSIVVELLGTRSNLRGVGAAVAATTPDGVTRSRQFFPYGGYLDSDEPIVHFGLGDQEKVERLEIRWPGGARQVFADLAAGHRYRVTEPDEDAAKEEPVKSMAPDTTRFRRSPALDEHPHVEDEYDDFARQPLMTFKLSQLGPGQAWGDIDGDGVPDLFLGGASGQPGRLFLNRTPQGSSDIVFEPVAVPAFEEDALHEDMGAAFVDATGDGRLDLYVASGSVECPAGDEMLRDRLYLNQGDGTFAKAPDGMLPDLRESSGVVAVADFTRDGRLEIFVGARSIPGLYPQPPRSVLLRWDGERYVDALESLGPDLAAVGMVCGAVWTDVDGDGWIDLLVATDWGPVRLYRNEGGRLAETTEQAGLAGEGLESLGWWTGIDARDLTGNGHIDFVASNMGLNTQYQPALLFPELLFSNDFDDTGQHNIVEARFVEENGAKPLYPRATFHDADFAMPFIGRLCQTYANYARLQITDIYPFEKLQSALQLRTNCAESSAFLNDGGGRFTRVPLPRITQVSPGFGIVLADVDLDGRPDCYLVHNHYNPTEEIGEMAMGLSQLLLGTGDPAAPFRAVGSQSSGLELRGDAKSLGTIDINRNGWVDFLAGVNNAEPELFVHHPGTPLQPWSEVRGPLALAASEARADLGGDGDDEEEGDEGTPLRIVLRGAPGNPQAIGSRVSVSCEGLPDQTAEVRGGGSYLAHHDPALVFARRAGDPATVRIRWPDGAEESLEAPVGDLELVVEKENP